MSAMSELHRQADELRQADDSDSYQQWYEEVGRFLDDEEVNNG